MGPIMKKWEIGMKSILFSVQFYYMNIKYNLVVIGLLLLAVVFVPFVPDDSMQSCDVTGDVCDDSVGYVSIYTKYFK